MIIIFFFYGILIISLIIGFNRVPVFKSKNEEALTTFSIIIPFRNEAKNLVELAESLEKITYPATHFEVFFVNDASTDASVSLLNPYLKKHDHWNLLDNQRQRKSPKKDAILTAIQKISYQWIITTDADCCVKENWLSVFNRFIQKNKGNISMIVGPVAYKIKNRFIEHFQNFDLLSLVGSTIGGFGIKRPFLCNGANLCYQKSAFLAVNGFEGNDTIASGDDIFLLEKMLALDKKSVHFLKSQEVIVYTKPENTFKQTIDQRIRWASKTGATKNWFGKLVGLIVFLMNFSLVIGLVYGIWSSTLTFENSLSFWKGYFMIFLIKFNLDFVLIQRTYSFLGLKSRLTPYFLSSVLYPFFVTLVVFLSFFRKYEWKGRRFSR